MATETDIAMAAMTIWGREEAKNINITHRKQHKKEQYKMDISKILRSAKCGVLGALVAMGMSAVAEPSVTVDKVESGEPWGEPWSNIRVSYTLGGVDSETDYKVAFDITADGQTASIANDAAKLMDGVQMQKINTVELFGKWVVDTKAKVKVSLISVKPNAKPQGGVQLWKDGPLFAECNVGATKPEEYGYYFWWGDTVGYKRDGNKWVSVKDNTTSISFGYDDKPSNQTYIKTDEELKSLGYIDDAAKPVLNAAHDAATAHLGEPWRMPTKDEIDSLLANCDKEWQDNWKNMGVKGWIFKGKGDYSDNSIFFPCAGYGYNGNHAGLYSPYPGYYWSSTPYTLDDKQAFKLSCDNENCYEANAYRFYGYPVRAVRGSAE